MSQQRGKQSKESKTDNTESEVQNNCKRVLEQVAGLSNVDTATLQDPEYLQKDRYSVKEPSEGKFINMNEGCGSNGNF